MSQLKKNIIANLVGNGWTAILSLALVPVYIRFMGVEAYGLVGIYVTLLTIFSLLDLGLSTTLNRELAHLSARQGSAREARDLVRTIEVVYWAVAALIALVMLLLAPTIADHWVHPQHLSPAAVQQTLYAIGIVVALQFPFALYSGGLLGLQRQVQLNVLSVTMATLRGAGAVGILAFVSPTIQAFFGWQIFVTTLQTVLSAFLLWRALPTANVRPRFHKDALISIWRFAGGMTGITVLGLLLSQLDKIILSNRLPLATFGYYSVATVVASGLYNVASPLYAALFPQFSRLVALGDGEALKTLYHRGCQLLSVVLLPVTIVVAFFSPEVLSVWTRNPLIVEHAHVLVTLLIIGTALNVLLSLPNALMYAHGWTKPALYSNVIAVVLIVPMLLWAISRFGAVGAAAAWIVLNVIYVLYIIQVMHTRLLRRERWRWYLVDIGLPALGALGVAALGRWLLPQHASLLTTVAWLAVIAAAAIAASALVTPFTRNWMRTVLLTRLLRRAGRHVEAGADTGSPGNTPFLPLSGQAHSGGDPIS